MSKKSRKSNSDNPQSGSSQDEISERDLVFDSQFLEDLTYWVIRLLSLVKEIRRNPINGTGKPEKLKYQDANVWSRRLTEADRIVYMVSDNPIDFLQARYHYSDR